MQDKQLGDAEVKWFKMQAKLLAQIRPTQGRRARLSRWMKNNGERTDMVVFSWYIYSITIKSGCLYIHQATYISHPICK